MKFIICGCCTARDAPAKSGIAGQSPGPQIFIEPEKQAARDVPRNGCAYRVGFAPMTRCGRLTRAARCVLVLLLFMLATGVRVMRARQQPVVAPDAIRHIEQGKMLLVHPLQAVREEVYHPLFSLAVVGVHGVIDWFYPMNGQGEWGERMKWVWAAQGSSVLCGAIMAVLVYALARRLGARFWPAMGAGVVWCVGQRVTAYSVDGMSDMLALCFFTGSLLAAIGATGFRWGGRGDMGLGWRQVWGFLLAGLLAGLAYLTRPEGLAVPLDRGCDITRLACLAVRQPAKTRFRRRFGFSHRGGARLQTYAMAWAAGGRTKRHRCHRPFAAGARDAGPSLHDGDRRDHAQKRVLPRH